MGNDAAAAGGTADYGSAADVVKLRTAKIA
jgi:hypothetical protein